MLKVELENFDFNSIDKYIIVCCINNTIFRVDNENFQYNVENKILSFKIENGFDNLLFDNFTISFLSKSYSNNIKLNEVKTYEQANLTSIYEIDSNIHYVKEAIYIFKLKKEELDKNKLFITAKIRQILTKEI